MIPELGHFSLILALAMAIIQTIFPIVGASRRNDVWIGLAKPAARLQFIFILFSFLLLTYAFLTHDFSLAYVSQNSNSLLPTVYRISAVWGAHEGSLLLWALILAFWTIMITYYSRNLPDDFTARVIGVMGSVSIGFLLFILLTSNPFERLFPAPFDGADLNPLLQDPGLIIHPPMLYMGYVGFSVAFGFAIAALLDRRTDLNWAEWLRSWAIVAWAFLTIGIALGSWWAYYELGWGGWWFWDPVENASFMPWLIGTALIHSLAATKKRNVFKNWTLLLAIIAFGLSLLGTFLVRSGVITSVHAFATDPGRGIFILVLLGIYIGGALILYAIRAPSADNRNQFKLFSRETFLLFNSIFMLVAMLTILLGTIYPLAVEALGLSKLSVGAPYFNAVFVPLMMPAIALIGIGTIVHWRQDKLSRVSKQLSYLLIASLITGTAITLLFYEDQVVKTSLGLMSAAWIILTSLSILARKCMQNKSISLQRITRGYCGMLLAHVGLALSIIGITITSQHSIDIHERMSPGDTAQIAGYTLTLNTIETIDGPNYQATQAVIDVQRHQQHVASLKTQKRLYLVRNMPMTEAGIDAGLLRDLYVSLGERLSANAWSIRIYHKPFVRFIWLGAILMVLGGLLAATERRHNRQRQATVSIQSA